MRYRLHYDQKGGFEMTADGKDVRRHWNWFEFTATHSHTPPIQPFCVSLNRYAPSFLQPLPLPLLDGPVFPLLEGKSFCKLGLNQICLNHTIRIILLREGLDYLINHLIYEADNTGFLCINDFFNFYRKKISS